MTGRRITLRERLRAAAAAFRSPSKGAYVVVYDFRRTAPGSRTPETEEYYGYFASCEEAIEMFDTAYPEDGSHGVAHNALLCREVERLRPQVELEDQ